MERVQKKSKIFRHRIQYAAFFAKFLEGTVTEKDFEDCKCAYVFNGFRDLFINTRGFDLLKSTNNKLVEGSQLTDKTLNFYNKFLAKFRLTELSLNETMHHQGRTLSKYDWWSDYKHTINPKGFENYVINNPSAKNELASFTSVLTITYLTEITNFIQESELLIQEIENRN